jgi:hypothetical protein
MAKSFSGSSDFGLQFNGTQQSHLSRAKNTKNE